MDSDKQHIKEEQEELWTSQEEEHLQELEGFTFTTVPLKSEDDEEKLQSLHSHHTEEMKIEADGEDFGGPETDAQPDTDDKTGDSSDLETDYSGDWRETREPPTGLNSQKNNKVHGSDVRCKTDEKPFSCFECGKKFSCKFNLKRHMRTHTGEKPFICSTCGKSYNQAGNLKAHMVQHTGEKRFSCTVCDKSFTWQYQLKKHKCGGESSHLHRLWTNQKREHHLELEDVDITTVIPVSVGSEDSDEEKPQSLHLHHIGEMKTEADGEDCGGPETDTQLDTSDKTGDSSEHETDDSGDWKETTEPPTSLNSQRNYKVQGSGMGCKTDEKHFSCSECGKRFSCKSNLNRHMRTHTGEKPFICPTCGKSYNQARSLKEHMVQHTGEKRFSCTVCDKSFTWQYQLKKHKCGGESSKLHRLWTNQRREHHLELEDDDITKVILVSVKSEDDVEEKPQSLQLHQTEQMKTIGEDCRGPEPDRHLQLDTDKTFDFSDSETNDSDDCKETREPELGLNYQNEEVPVSNVRCTTHQKTSSYSEGGQRCTQSAELTSSMGTDREEKIFICSLCGKSFTRKTGLDHHMKTHTGEKPYSCSYCNKSFSLSAHLKLHVRTHTGEKPFSCSVCDKRFTWRTQLKRHKCSSKLHEHWANQEGEQLQRVDDADETNNEERPQSFQLHESYAQQLEKKADGDDCGGPEPARNSDSDRHLQPVSDNKIEDPSESVTGDDRKDSIEPHPDLVPVGDLRHYTDENRDIKCGEKPFRCSECDKGFYRKDHLVVHMRTHTGEKPYSCSVCKKHLRYKGDVRRHMTIHTRDKLETINKSFSCSECGKRYSRKEYLLAHMRSHTGEKPFSCSVCKKHFRYKGDIQRHMKIHTRDKFRIIVNPFSCSECGKRYSRKHHLVIHMRTHTGEKPYTCSVCNKSFSRSKYLQSHTRTHTGEKPFSCSVCGKSFSQKCHLQFHLKGYSGEKPHSCSLCNKGFLRSRDLKRHLRTHTGERPYSCSVCNQRFAWLYQFKRHKCGNESLQFHEICTNQDGDQLQGPEEADITTFTPAFVKSVGGGDDEEEPQS